MNVLKAIGIFFIVIIITGVLTFIGYFFNYTDTVANRVITKNSFQYQEGMAQRAAILKANIAAISIIDVLRRAELNVEIAKDPSNEDLRNQRKILQAQLTAITINQ